MSDEEVYGRLQSFLSAPPAAEKAPRPEASHHGIVSHYRIIRRRARGGVASVFEAEDSKLGRKVALKVMIEGNAHPTQVTRLRREASITAQFRHPNIVRVYEAGSVQARHKKRVHFIAMDWIDGPSLAEVLRERSMALIDVLRVLEDAARAIAHAHEAGVVHRDIKPGNILVDPSGRGLLTDFGLARSDSADSVITGAHAVLGTPQYMAPEQIQGFSREIGAWTDTWSLGVILYEALTGRPPFEGTKAELQERIVNEPVVPPSVLDPAVDPDLEAICLRALSKSIWDRYSTGQEFLDELERWRMGSIVAGRSRSALESLSHAIARRRPFLAAAAMGAATGVMGGSIAVVAIAKPESGATALILASAAAAGLALLSALLRRTVPVSVARNAVPDAAQRASRINDKSEI